jgi:hypothetical protein
MPSSILIAATLSAGGVVVWLLTAPSVHAASSVVNPGSLAGTTASSASAPISTQAASTNIPSSFPAAQTVGRTLSQTTSGAVAPSAVRSSGVALPSFSATGSALASAQRTAGQTLRQASTASGISTQAVSSAALPHATLTGAIALVMSQVTQVASHTAPALPSTLTAQSPLPRRRSAVR